MGDTKVRTTSSCSSKQSSATPTVETLTSLFGVTVRLCCDPTLKEASTVWSLTKTVAEFMEHDYGKLKLEAGVRVCDMSAGTGGFGLCLVKRYSECHVVCTDIDSVVPQIDKNIQLLQDGGWEEKVEEKGGEKNQVQRTSSNTDQKDHSHPHQHQHPRQHQQHQHYKSERKKRAHYNIFGVPFLWGGDATHLTDKLGGPIDVLVACECFYWGGWDIFAQDTRIELVQSFLDLLPDAATDTDTDTQGPRSRSERPRPVAYVAFTVRNIPRELPLLELLAELFDIKYAQGSTVLPLPDCTKDVSYTHKKDIAVDGVQACVGVAGPGIDTMTATDLVAGLSTLGSAVSGKKPRQIVNGVKKGDEFVFSLSPKAYSTCKALDQSRGARVQSTAPSESSEILASTITITSAAAQTSQLQGAPTLTVQIRTLRTDRDAMAVCIADELLRLQPRWL